MNPRFLVEWPSESSPELESDRRIPRTGLPENPGGTLEATPGGPLRGRSEEPGLIRGRAAHPGASSTSIEGPLGVRTFQGPLERSAESPLRGPFRGPLREGSNGKGFRFEAFKFSMNPRFFGKRVSQSPRRGAALRASPLGPTRNPSPMGRRRARRGLNRPSADPPDEPRLGATSSPPGRPSKRASRDPGPDFLRTPAGPSKRPRADP